MSGLQIGGAAFRAADCCMTLQFNDRTHHSLALLGDSAIKCIQEGISQTIFVEIGIVQESSVPQPVDMLDNNPTPLVQCSKAVHVALIQL